MSAVLKIDLFTDFVCPWCLVGARRLDEAIAGLPDDITVEIENHPFYLDASTPAEGVIVADMLRERYGRDPKEMWARVEGEAKASGMTLDLSRQPRMFPTAKAHTITRLAKERGTQHALANAITEAYFLLQQQINDDAVLARLAAAHGFTEDEAIRLINDAGELATTEEIALAAARQGINGVPFFIFNNKYALSGAQPQAVFEQALQQVSAESRA